MCCQIIDLFLFFKDDPDYIDDPYGWCATATDEFGNYVTGNWDFCAENCKSMNILIAVEEFIKICNISKVKTVYYCSIFVKNYLTMAIRTSKV